jgi:hypothetical protein
VEFFEFAKDPTISPTGLPGHLNDQFADFLRLSWTARFGRFG